MIHRQACTRTVRWRVAVHPKPTICLKTLESLVLEKVLSGTQRGISPSLELALVRCIFAIIAFSSFCSEGRTRRLGQMFALSQHNMPNDNIKEKERTEKKQQQKKKNWMHQKRSFSFRLFTAPTAEAYSHTRMWRST